MSSPILLPLAPRPHTDELISSWIARIGSVYGLTSYEILKYMSWSGMDIDYNPNDSDLKKLSNLTNYPIKLIKKLTLKSRYPKRKRDAFFMVKPNSKHLPVYCAACFERDIKQGGAAILALSMGINLVSILLP